jgi:hypothetical protein
MGLLCEAQKYRFGGGKAYEKGKFKLRDQKRKGVEELYV